jgi:lysyl-tRNA synthetase class 2
MRRSPQSPNGTIELMVTELLQQAETVGVNRVSLNFAMFRSAFEQGAQLGAGPVARLWRGLLVFFSRWWQLETLYRSNMKYQPQWVPRYACYEDTRLIPRVGVASVIAEGFLVLPFSRRGRQHTGHHPAVPHGATAQPATDVPFVAAVDAAGDRTQRLPEQVRVRMAKLQELADRGVDAYPVGRPPTHTVAAALAAGDGTAVVVSGRVLRTRDYGGVTFATLRDWSGDVQLLLEKSGLDGDAEDFAAVDLGDLVEVTGRIGFSRNGTRSVLVTSWRMLGKCLRPLPDKWKGLTDPEARVRARYVDLAINPEARDVIEARSAILRSIRETLFAKGFLEVETPILQRIHGGANARPFQTHINAYDLDLYLRIAPELFLKRCVVGGLDKVFELNRNFRNEGADSTHSPEFAMLETYEAWGTYDDSATMIREIVQEVADEALGTRQVSLPDGSVYDLDGEWPSLQMYPSLSAALGEEITPETSLEYLLAVAERLGVEIPSDRGYGHGKLIEELWEHTVGDALWAPTFVKDFPVETTPLTREHRSIAGVTEKWDLYVRGFELATGYSELVDPIIQRERFEAQARAAAAGDDEAMALDEDFLAAMEYAMPPTTGTGMGIDRLLMALTGLSIRETVLFPIVRRQV